MIVFADSSALAKRYVLEEGSAQVAQVLADADVLVVAAIAPIEIVSALTRRQRAGDISRDAYTVVRRELTADLADIDRVPVDDALVVRAMALVETHALRTHDGLQLASALAAQPHVFLCADGRLLEAAASEGLKVVDPTVAGGT
jgi:predicted nucleic acid-binding protein